MTHLKRQKLLGTTMEVFFYINCRNNPSCAVSTVAETSRGSQNFRDHLLARFQGHDIIQRQITRKRYKIGL